MKSAIRNPHVQILLIKFQLAHGNACAGGWEAAAQMRRNLRLRKRRRGYAKTGPPQPDHGSAARVAAAESPTAGAQALCFAMSLIVSILDRFGRSM